MFSILKAIAIAALIIAATPVKPSATYTPIGLHPLPAKKQTHELQ